MRLIDADELKKKFKDSSYWTYTHEYGDAIPIGWIMSGIDNAPTVEPYTKDDMTREYLKGYNACKDMNERPQGEWIDHEKHIECNQCHVWFLKDYLIRKSFCPNCGADMKGERE